MTDDRRLARNPIAIVGMSGLLPNAHNHREYWQNIVDGVDCTTEVPASRWSLDDYFDPDAEAPDKTYSRRGAFLPDIEFDPLEFGLPPNQLEVTSTMQTLSLGVARDLLRDAGAVDSAWYDASRTGVVLGTTGPVPLMHPLAARLSTPVLKEAARSVGLSDTDADAIADRFVAAFAPWEANSFPGLLANITAGRVANRLGLGGINCTVDAACAASLAALRTAIAELQDGRADMMITGGVDTENTIFIYMCFSKVGALSSSGRISPFSAEANGTLLGEGITMLALRRLEDARRDGNRIYAVIRGLGSSSDGRAKSIYAPRAGGQRVALDRAYADAEISPADVALIEAHATGTPVGDKTELTALKELLTDATSEPAFAALGSVKSQIGHTKGAAGTASMMKLALALHQKVLPGTINVTAPNAEIAAADAPYYVNTRTRPWIRDPQRPVRRAAASAFGFGGTNFHVVLEEADTGRGAHPVLHRTARAHLWHAPDVAGLIDAVRSVASSDGGDIPEHHARIGFVSVDEENAAHLRSLAVDELVRNPDAAAWDHPEGVYFRAAALPERKAGALFAGQGSQYVDMGSDAALNNPAVGAAFDAANDAFAGAPVRLSSVVFPPPAFDDAVAAEQEEALRRTEFAQPAIGALSAGQFTALSDYGFRAGGYLGHSFGELTALWASGALATVDFYALARARGVAMTPERGVEAGTMVALGASRQTAEELLDGVEDVWICNHNAPDQVVVGGGPEGIAAVVDRCGERGVATRALPVSGAFHTPYVAHATAAFAPAVAEMHIGAPDAPVFANTPGARYSGDVAANRAVLTEQLGKPVEFVAALTAMRDAGCTVFVEFGPKQVLTSLVRRTLGDDAVVIATDSGPIGNSDLALTRAAVRLAVLGFGLHDINRHAAPAPEAEYSGVSGRAMAVTLSAPEYVPESRRAAYAAALDDDYRLSVLAAPERVLGPDAAPVDSAVDHQPIAETPAVPAAFTAASETLTVYPTPQPGDAGSDALESALVQHLQTHRQFLDGQLDMARGLAGALGDGRLDAATVRAIEAVKEHGVAISHSHARASAVLAQLVELESGFAPVSRPSTQVTRPAAPAPRAAIEPAPVRRPLATATVVDDHRAAPAAEAVAVPATPEVVPNGRAAETPTGDDRVSNEALRRVLREVVAEKTGYPVEMVDPSMDLEADLGVDSIKRVQVIGAVQERFPHLPNLGPEQLGTVRTLDQVADLFGGASATGSVETPAASNGSAAPAAGIAAADGQVSSDVLRRALREVVAEKTGYPVEMVDPSMDLEADLGVDSIKRVQVIGAVQERFPTLPSLGPEQLGTLRTLDQVADLLGASGGAPTSTSAMATNGHGADDQVSDEALRRALLEVVAEKTGYPVEMVDPSMDLEADLGVDSIKRVQVIGALQERFPDLPSLGPEQLGTLRTLDQIVLELAGVAGGGVHPKAEAAAGTSRHAVELASLPSPDRAVAPYRDGARAVLVDLTGEQDADSAALGAALDGLGWTVRYVDSADAIDTEREPIDLCLVLVGGSADWESARRSLTDCILLAGRALPPLRRAPGRAAFVTVTRLDGGLGFLGGAEPVHALLGGVGGVVKTLAAEQPELFCRALDIDPFCTPARLVEFVTAELFDPARDTLEVGIDAAGERRTLVPSGHAPAQSVTAVRPGVEQDPTMLTADDVLLVTGGARGVTATCVLALAARSEARFVLLGRSEPSAEPDWATGISDAELKPAAVRALAGTGATPRDVERAVSGVRATREIQATLAALGSRADYLAVDATDEQAVAAALAPWRESITGVVHGAGVLADSMITDKTAESIARVLDPKIAGLATVLGSLGELRHLVLFTSVAGLFGNAGQADYAAANEALSRFAVSWRRCHPNCHVTAIDWGAWDGGMVTPALREHFRARGVELLDPRIGAAAFTEQFTAARAEDTVVLIGPAKSLSEAAGIGAATVRTRRTITGITEDPIIAAHRIGEHIVLPATFGLGAMVNLAERVLPGRTVVGVRDFQVLKGIVFDRPVDELELELAPGANPQVGEPELGEPTTTVHATVRGGDAIHFRATLLLADAADGAPHRPIPGGPADDTDIYRDAIQFHAPALQGLRRIRAVTDDAIVFDCELPAATVARGGYAGRLHDPVLADLILQGPPVLGYRLLGSACLPLGVGRIDYYRPLPAGEPFVLTVDNPRPGRLDARIDATVTATDGTVLQRFSDVTVVTTPDLTEKFQTSVRRWMA
ncbi:phosphopantetheine-binding protein [Nocardia sp. NBC_00508]|uniref:beta-ketoacyl synthase N-terminal-like domain-containing protein n=1 Tax=Nocardia sp. NBC_00508 TaxID=2975992 RepID=UPI002E81D69C|nr:beta-ketoacyl synthase N-terminal-like domain-containing protein [Nocardia sp. NBC_00508]WUD67220.1 phosphopantetheine-binding protein [Nocardia sp. NBC_00508]